MTAIGNDLYVTSLAEGSIRKLTISDTGIRDQGIVFPELRERLRDITTAPDGNLYLLTDGDLLTQLVPITISNPCLESVCVGKSIRVDRRADQRIPPIESFDL